MAEIEADEGYLEAVVAVKSVEGRGGGREVKAGCQGDVDGEQRPGRIDFQLAPDCGGPLGAIGRRFVEPAPACADGYPARVDTHGEEGVADGPGANGTAVAVEEAAGFFAPPEARH